MRALTLHRPWDWAMAHGGKDIENRPWKPWDSVIGARIALHAGKHYDVGARGFIDGILGFGSAPEESRTSGGVIVATTRILGWVLLARDARADCTVVAQTSEIAPSRLASAMKSPWLFGPYGWICADPIALREPVPCKGAQGLWHLPANVEREVLRKESEVR